MLKNISYNKKFLWWLQNHIPGKNERVLIEKGKVLKAFSLISTALLIFYFTLFSSLHFFPKGPLCLVVTLLPIFLSALVSICAFTEKVAAALFIMTWVLPTTMAFASWHDPVYNYSKVIVIYMLVIFLAHDSKMRQVISFLFLAIIYSWVQIRHDNSLEKSFSDHTMMLDFTMMMVFCLIMFFVFSRIKMEFILYQNEVNSQRDRLEKKKAVLENLMFMNKEKSERLKQSVLLKEKLISIISHDVRTPINSFKFMIETYEHGHIDQQTLIEGLLEAKQDIINLDKMVIDLVNWQKNDSARKKTDMIRYGEVINMFESVKSIYKLSAKNKNLDIIAVVNMQRNMQLVVPIREAEIIIRNLLSNAIKFSHSQGKIVLELREVISTSQLFAILTVRDFGVGMNREVLKELNNNKAISTIGTLDEIGLGVGLSIVLDIIHKHGFDYSIKSEPGNGTAFSIKIPLVHSL